MNYGKNRMNRQDAKDAKKREGKTWGVNLVAHRWGFLGALGGLAVSGLSLSYPNA